jgi:hypothetical protein
MKKGDGIKITVAVVVLVAAALLIYNFLRPSPVASPTPTETSGPVHGQPRTPGGAPH